VESYQEKLSRTITDRKQRLMYDLYYHWVRLDPKADPKVLLREADAKVNAWLEYERKGLPK